MFNSKNTLNLMRQFFPQLHIRTLMSRVCATMICLCLLTLTAGCDDDADDGNNNNNNGGSTPLNCAALMTYLLTPSGGTGQNVSGDDASGTLSTTVLVIASSGGENAPVITLTINKGVNELELNKRYELGNMLQNPQGDFEANARLLDQSAQQSWSISGGITLTSNSIIDDNPVIKIRCIEGTFDAVLAPIGAPENTQTISGGSFTARVSGN